MKELTVTEANACLAEMRGEKWGIVNGTMWLYSKETGETVCRWNPYERVEQAIAALEAWADSGECMEAVIKISPRRSGVFIMTAYRSMFTSIVEHKSLSVAICTALCSAIEEEEVRIEG